MKPKPAKTTVVPDFEQLPFEVDQIRCPKCGTIQSAKIIHGWPRYIYEHTCANARCGHLIKKKDWKSIL